MTLQAQAEIEKICTGLRPLPVTDLDRLAVLRHTVGLQYVSEESSRLPLEPTQGLFAGVTGAPEVLASELTGAHLACGIGQYGVLVVRGLVAPTDVRRLCSLIDGKDWSVPQCPSDSLGTKLPGSSPMKCSTASLQALIDAYQNAGMQKILQDYLGEPPVLLSERMLLDRQTFQTGLPWHQDGAFFGAHVGGVNSFLALDDCGVDAVGLSVAAHRFSHLVRVAEGERATLDYGTRLTDDDVRELAGDEAIVTPKLEAGDAIFIDEMTMHRTGERPNGKQKPRSWATTWFFAPSRFPDMRHPLWFGNK